MTVGHPNDEMPSHGLVWGAYTEDVETGASNRVLGKKERTERDLRNSMILNCLIYCV